MCLPNDIVLSSRHNLFARRREIEIETQTREKRHASVQTQSKKNGLFLPIHDLEDRGATLMASTGRCMRVFIYPQLGATILAIMAILGGSVVS